MRRTIFASARIAVMVAAKSAAVPRLVYTSFVNPCDDSSFPFAKVHAATERDMLSSGLACTFLGSNQYFENLNTALKIAWQTGVLSMPGVSEKVAYLARADMAAAKTQRLEHGSGHLMARVSMAVKIEACLKEAGIKFIGADVSMGGRVRFGKA